MLHRLAHGDDRREVTTHREAKSRGAETTLGSDETDLTKLEDIVRRLARRVADRPSYRAKPGRTVVLKVRYSDFTTITRSRSQPEPVEEAEAIAQIAIELLHGATDAGERPVRLVGVTVSGLVGDGEPVQLALDFEHPPEGE